jgi:hypothetical protein
VIFSYQGYSRLHTMFKNICAREKFSDFDNLPTQILVPHFFESMISFDSICEFIVERLNSMQSSQPTEFEHQKSIKSEKSKAYYTFETRKLAMTYMESHRQYLVQKVDKVKIDNYIQSKGDTSTLLKNHAGSSTCVLSNIKMDVIKESGAAQKTLFDLRKFNEGIRTERQMHSVLYYKRVTKYTQRQMRNLLNDKNSATEPPAVVTEQETVKTINKMKEICTHRFIVMKKRRKLENTEP